MQSRQKTEIFDALINQKLRQNSIVWQVKEYLQINVN